MVPLSQKGPFRTIHVMASPVAPCPRCGALAKLNEIRPRFFWEPHFERESIVEVMVPCYICSACPLGERWFMVLPHDYQTSGQYTVMAKLMVLALVSEAGMAFEVAAAFAATYFHLTQLHATTIMDWFRDKGEHVDKAAHMQNALKLFSGQMAIDEVYDGGYYQIKVTDPLSGLEIVWKMGKGSPNEEDVKTLLLELKAAGFMPSLIVTDGSTLYPKVIKEVWPACEHQRCVFHVIKQINVLLMQAFWVLYNAMPKVPKRKPGRPRKNKSNRGRKRSDETRKANRLTVKNARFFLMTREEHLTDDERATLNAALGLCQGLSELRRFVLAVYELFGPTTDSHECATARRDAILNNPAFQTMACLSKAMKILSDDDLFIRLTRYLDFENAEKTSNHVERMNRLYRKRQKGHYRLRSLRSIYALLDLLRTRRPAHMKEPLKLIRKSRDGCCTQQTEMEVAA